LFEKNRHNSCVYDILWFKVSSYSVVLTCIFSMSDDWRMMTNGFISVFKNVCLLSILCYSMFINYFSLKWIPDDTLVNCRRYLLVQSFIRLFSFTMWNYSLFMNIICDMGGRLLDLFRPEDKTSEIVDLYKGFRHSLSHLFIM